MDKKLTRCDLCVIFYFSFYWLLNMFRATKCPSSGADECVVLSPRVGIVPWLQDGCQNRLAGSASIEEFVDGHMVVRNMLSNLKNKTNYMSLVLFTLLLKYSTCFEH